MALNTTVRFADGFDHPDTIAFGLEGPQLAVVVSGALLAWGLLRAPLPGALADVLAALVALLAGGLGVGRWAGRPLLTWAWLAGRFWLSPRHGGGVLLAKASGDGSTQNAPSGETAPGGDAAGGGPRRGREDDEREGEQPAWVRWLREGGVLARGGPREDAQTAVAAPTPEGARHGDAIEPVAAQPAKARRQLADGLLPHDPEDPPAPTPVEMWLAALGDGSVPDATARSLGAQRCERATPDRGGAQMPPPSSPPPGAAMPSLGELVRRLVGRVRGADDRTASTPVEPAAPSPPRRPAAAAEPSTTTGEPEPTPGPEGRTVELDRPPLVLLPSADTALVHEPMAEEESDTSANETSALEDGEPALAAVIPLVTRRDDDLDEELMLELAERQAATAVTQCATDRTTARGDGDGKGSKSGDGPRAPVFVGAPRRITFFSLNGGSGRTTLATEVACLLAARGRHRPDPEAPPQRLRVALVDLDLRSSNTALRLGVPRPTLWDYLLATGDDADDVRRFLVHHSSGLQALLGPPKPLSTTAAAVEPARIAGIVHQLESDGCHFLVFDVGSDLGAVSTWVLSQVHDIYVVITPTGSGLQDAYRTTETLRRLGLGQKLRYVVNRARGNVDVDEVMGDLGGRVVATIPYDPRLEDAENTHTIASLRGGGPAADAIQRLARTIYPSLDGRGGRRGLWRRRAG